MLCKQFLFEDSQLGSGKVWGGTFDKSVKLIG